MIVTALATLGGRDCASMVTRTWPAVFQGRRQRQEGRADEQEAADLGQGRHLKSDGSPPGGQQHPVKDTPPDLGKDQHRDGHKGHPPKRQGPPA